MSVTVTIVCYGDSTIYGRTTNGSRSGPASGADGAVTTRVAEPAPAALQRLLQAKYGPSVTVENYGIPGTTCADWLNGTSGVPRAWAAEMAASTADLVLICLGINDEPPELATNYPQLVQIAEVAEHRLLIQTPNQLNITWGEIGTRAATEVSIRQAHPRSLLVDFYAYTAGLGAVWYDQLSYSEMFSSWSGIHPNQQGYETMAAQEFAVLDPIVGGMLGQPTGKLSVVPPGAVMESWVSANVECTVVNVIDLATGTYFGGKAVPGVSYTTDTGNAGAHTFTLPPGRYALELYGYSQGAWVLLDQQQVVVT